MIVLRLKNIKIRIFLAILLFALIAYRTSGQTGGSGVYKFLNQSVSSRASALGGINISLRDSDPACADQNPALLNSEMNRHLSLNYTLYFADIKYGYTGYAFNTARFGTFSSGIRFVNYGTFTASDETGQITGDFKASEYALNLIWAMQLTDRITAGVNIKPVISQLETYKSYGIATDLGINWFDPEKQLSAGIAAKNIGTQIKTYRDGNSEKLPFDLQAGLSKKLAHAPFRVHLTAHDLYRWNLLYDKPENNNTSFGENNYSGEEGTKFSRFLDNGLRHLIIGVDLVPFKSFYLSAAYNHLRRKEMHLEEKTGAAGFSWGFGLQLKKFWFAYARSSYHVAGASNNFSLGLNFNEFGKNKLQKASE